RGFAAAAVHGDLGQAQRERALRAFRYGKVDVLVATDVAARGLDVEDVTHVVNYECPEDDKAYLHRIGRTGRAGRSGVAVTFVDWNDLTRWKVINDALGLGHPEPPETYSTSQHLCRALGIPAAAGTRLAADKGGRQGLEAEELEDFAETGRHRSAAGRRSGGAERGRTRRSPRPRRRTRGGVPVVNEGTAPAEHAPGHTASLGSASHGTAPNATAPNATAPNATAPNGSAPNSSAPHGTAPRGGAPRRRRRRGRGRPTGSA